MSQVMNQTLKEKHASNTVADSPAVQKVSDWLVQQGLQGSSLEELFSGYCARLVDIGIPLWRGHIGMRILHPVYGSQTFTWRSDEGTIKDAFEYSPSNSEEWMQSPYFWMIENNIDAHSWRIEKTVDGYAFPMFEQFDHHGGAEYLARIVGYGEDGIIEGKTGLLSSYITQRPTGFSREEIRVIDRLTKRLALLVKTLLNIEISKNIVDTYIGREAGRRVLKGEIRRGYHSIIPAAIYFADLREFTSLTDRLPREDVLPMLDSYFECLVKPLIEAGGDVLNFTGDGILGAFNLEGRDETTVCHAAVDAALESFRLMKELNRQRSAERLETTTFDIVLHSGNVAFGNVGALDRLDFTAIGPAVNEAARIEQLCDALDCNLLLSDRFTQLLGECPDIKSLGVHAFRGLRRSYELYTVSGQ
ncbi:MAG: adenylate/guanylate cyclase domain-containing protein [Methyloligellaceae bacterium]